MTADEKRRASERAKGAVCAYMFSEVGLQGRVDAPMFANMLADLRHYCEVHDIDFKYALDLSASLYRSER